MKRSQWFISGALAGLTGITSSLVVCTYRRTMRDATQRLSQSQVVQTAVGLIEYAVCGDGPPVLVVHGAGGGFDQGQYISQAGGEGFRWIAVSRFGYLGTPLPDDPSHETQAEAHLALLDALEIPKAAVIGLSAGGPSALLLALRYPQRCSALVMVSAVSGPLALNVPLFELALKFAFNGDFFDWLLYRLSIPVLKTNLGISSQLWARLTLAQKGWLTEYLRQVPPLSRRRSGLLWDKEHLPRVGHYPLEEITIPAMVVHAADDPLVPTAHGLRTAQAISGAQLVMVEDGGHLLMGRHQEAWGQVRAFLSSCTDGGAA